MILNWQALWLNTNQMYPLLIGLAGIYCLSFGLKVKPKKRTEEKEQPTFVSQRPILIYIGLLLITVAVITPLMKNCITMKKETKPPKVETPVQKKLPKFTDELKKLKAFTKTESLDACIIIDLSKQKLSLINNATVITSYPISSSKYGIGNKANSNKTPLGIHRVKTKFGKDAEFGTIFKSRQNTKKIATIMTDPVDIPEDYVTSRIMWLEGLEKGVNSGKGIDSYKRHIYIHGTPEEGLIGTPASHGCIRMKNKDVIELFGNVPKNTLVLITD